jgi:hypothetical protein
VTELTRRIAILREVDAWFGERGFGLILTEEDGEYWAHLFPKSSLIVSVPKYGRGRSQEEAAERARGRFKIEQEGR